MPADPIPDAVAAVVQAVLDDRPDCDPGRRGHLIVRELRALGWRIEAPEVVPRHNGGRLALEGLEGGSAGRRAGPKSPCPAVM